ncbi:VOC family protein [Oryzibacter oryziterrae]|uniref:VOC family protein n=1 Tax=Oryzibacter oryziterrae TaxID=2766474 RepID=UPI001F3B2226|nr:VOC family protein [Oryzibacter oryziterrae]
MSAPKLEGLLETALYVSDLQRSAAFYRDILGLTPLSESPRLVALDAGAQGVLLLFQAGATSADLIDDDGCIPGHEGTGRLHMAFAIAADQLQHWRDHLAAKGIPLAGEAHWKRGGTSLYIRDPDGHAIEFATPGLWPTR